MELLDGVFDDFDAHVEVIELFEEMTEELLGIESNKLRGAIAHKYLDGVIHLAEFSHENLVDLVQQDVMLDQIFFDKVVLRRTVDQNFIVFVARTRIFGEKDQLPLW